MSGSRSTLSHDAYSVKAKEGARQLFKKQEEKKMPEKAAAPSLAAEQLKAAKKKEEEPMTEPSENFEPRISLSDGEPIGRVQYGVYDKSIVYVTDKPGEPFDGADPIHLLGTDFFKGKKRGDGKRITTRDLEELKDALIDQSAEYLDEPLIDLFADALEHFRRTNMKELLIHDEGCLLPLPDCTRRECIYVSGPSGSGKSTWIARYCNAFRKLVPEVKVFVFSRLKCDKVIDLLKPIRIVLDDAFAKDEAYEPAHFAESIVLFDDCDTIPDKKVNDKVNKLRDDILETGRHQNVWCLSTGHQLTNYRKTRIILNECTKVTVFPRSGSSYHIRRLLKEYFGFDTTQIARAVNLPSRWITVTRTAPQIVMHEKGAYVV